MANKRPFLRDFYYFTDTKLIRKHYLEWMLFDQAVESGGRVKKPHYAKSLDDLLPLAQMMAAPVFFLVEPTSALMYVPVTLVSKKASITVLATPDSGADVSCFPSEVAGALGIDIDKLKKAKAFAGPDMFQVDSFPSKIGIVVGSAKEGVVGTVDFIKRKDARSLLGWNTFFGTHEVVFSPAEGIKYRLSLD
ncbi:hypothetical protein HGA34_05560 [Candidatus Falkowbacteria bacterium]|nr:hypothetical protein [Candidatus Falkowbacteria bacterium]